MVTALLYVGLVSLSHTQMTFRLFEGTATASYVYHWYVLACCSSTTACVMRESACWTSGGVCTVCPERVLMSFCRPKPRCASQTTCGPSTASASPGPPAELRHPASDRATPVQTGCTSCTWWRSSGAAYCQRSTMWGSPALCPGTFSLPQLPSEVLLWPSDISVCRNTGREKRDDSSVIFYQVTFLLQSAGLIAISETCCNVLFWFRFFFFCMFKKKEKNPFQPPCS